MPEFRRVEDRSAGPNALGILIPPGLQTFVILRPRALAWDLLPILRSDVGETGPKFHHMSREEGATLAKEVQQGLTQTSQKPPIEVRDNPWGDGFISWLFHGNFFWLPCPRNPGQPYQGVVFPTLNDAEEGAQLLAEFFFPSGDRNQEFYFNTQHFK